MDKERGWTILLVGGPSGTGKSSAARALARHYGVNILEIDDITEALKAVTTGETLPALHYFETGIDWKAIGVEKNVEWLIRVSGEIAPGLRAVIADHLETGVPVIIEGDFLTPEFAASFDTSQVQALFLWEAEEQQIVRNYLDREGGEPQVFRAAVSAAYGEWIAAACRELRVSLLEARPWETCVERAVGLLT